MQVEYVDYDKITDDMMYLGNNINLRFNVLLSKKNSSTDNSRRFFHSEYRYESKYDDTQVAVTIKRCFSYYMSIDVGGDNWDRSVMIRIQDIIILRELVSMASKWMIDNTFEVKDGNLTCKRRNTLKMSLPDGKYLCFDPVVIEWNNIQNQGVRITISDPSIYVDMISDLFLGFKYLIDTVDMFGYAQNMVNYLGRPENGFNLSDFERDQQKSEKAMSAPVKASKGRQIPGARKNKSAFGKE